MEIRAGDRVYKLICSTSPEADEVQDWAGYEDYEYLLDYLNEFRFFGLSYYEVIFLHARHHKWGEECAPYIWVNITAGSVRKKEGGMALEWLDYKSSTKFWIKRVTDSN